MIRRTLFLLFMISLGMSFQGHSQTLFHEVVELDSSYSKELLLENADRTLERLLGVKKSRKKKSRDNRITEIEGGFKAPFGYYVYKLKHPVFRVNYSITIEVKEGRYRYILDQYDAEKYIRNRYGRYEPARNGQLDLSEEYYAQDQKSWDKARSMVQKNADSVIALIKLNMSEKPIEDQDVLTLKDDW